MLVCSENHYKVAATWLKLAGHCFRYLELPASALVLWKPCHGRKSQERPAKIMVDILKENIGLANTGELRTLMHDRDGWRIHCHARWKLKEWVSECHRGKVPNSSPPICTFSSLETLASWWSKLNKQPHSLWLNEFELSCFFNRHHFVLASQFHSAAKKRTIWLVEMMHNFWKQ